MCGFVSEGGHLAGAGPGRDMFAAIAGEDELWDGEMESYDVDGEEVLLVRLDGEYHAYDGICPHQSSSLVEGRLDDSTLTCSAHEWVFDARTGQGINPHTACLRRREVRVADGCVLVSRVAVPASGAR
jgi:nitrite reductase/ring-hydroxylating ferredoxin subunit